VRYDARHKRDPFLVDVLGPFVEWVPVCPELELGMGVPREPICLVGLPKAPRLVAARSGVDYTETMHAWAERRAAELEREDLCGYISKKDSPSCGLERVPVHPARGGGPPRREGTGAWARVLLARQPLLPVEEEGRLHDPSLRESFIERVFACARWKAMLAEGLTRGSLVAFHTAHKLTLLAHSSSAWRRLGKLVDVPGRGSVGEAARAYGEGFMEALKVPATRGRHTSVLRHMLGHFRHVLRPGDRRELEELVSDYGRGLVPLIVPLTLFRHHVRTCGVTYLAGQVYLDPDPRELMLRNHV